MILLMSGTISSLDAFNNIQGSLGYRYHLPRGETQSYEFFSSLAYDIFATSWDRTLKTKVGRVLVTIEDKVKDLGVLEAQRKAFEFNKIPGLPQLTPEIVKKLVLERVIAIKRSLFPQEGQKQTSLVTEAVAKQVSNLRSKLEAHYVDKIYKIRYPSNREVPNLGLSTFSIPLFNVIEQFRKLEVQIEKERISYGYIPGGLQN